MSDIYNQVSADQDVFKNLLSKIPGFSGYFERQNRRSADKLLRESIAKHYEQLWQRISGIQRDLISQGQIESIDDIEAASIKLRQFIDRIRTATYGYSGFFDAIKINQEELTQVYQYDYTLVQLEDSVSNALDNVEASIGSDGLPAAIRNLVKVSQQCVDAFEKRVEVLTGISSEKPQ